MLTNPNTLGLFEEDIAEMAAAVHDAGGLLYYDGANLNAILGVTRPGDMGFDIVHLNLHKTFAVPHGGGGPGAGPVAVSRRLADFLPGPVPQRLDDGTFAWVDARAFASAGSMAGTATPWPWPGPGPTSWPTARDGLRRVSEAAVLNANWLLAHLRGTYYRAVRPPRHARGRGLHLGRRAGHRRQADCGGPRSSASGCWRRVSTPRRSISRWSWPRP